MDFRKWHSNDKYTAAAEKQANVFQETSRYSFTHDVLKSPKGLWLQQFMKVVSIKFLEWKYSQILKRYSNTAFIFQDPRLYFIQQFTREYFAENMETRKQEILNKGIDIILFYLKEDIFYRVRFIDMLMKFIDTYRVVRWDTNTKVIGTIGEPLFGLDEPEQEMLKLWKGK